MASSAPLVSIVTPSFNQGQFIRDTIESVLSQSYTPLDYWIIDGGSTDNTRDVVQEYVRDSRLHWISEPDNGQADAVSKGWSLGRGTILGWLNSDDAYLPGAIDAAVRVLLDHPELAFVYGDCKIVSENQIGAELMSVRQASLEDQLLFRCLIPQQSVFLRRWAYEVSGGIDTRLHYALDQDLWTRILEFAPGRYVTGVWAQQRIHSQAKTQVAWKRLYAEFHDILSRYRHHVLVPASVFSEAWRRSSLNMFIASLARNDFEAAVDHLQSACSDSCYPFDSISYSMKHTRYILLHWLERPLVEDLVRQLREASDDRVLATGARSFIMTLSAGLAHSVGRVDSLASCRSYLQRAIAADPRITLDPYIVYMFASTYLGHDALQWLQHSVKRRARPMSGFHQ